MVHLAVNVLMDLEDEPKRHMILVPRKDTIHTCEKYRRYINFPYSKLMPTEKMDFKFGIIIEKWIY